MKVLMVCLGNICRSPLAEGILSAKVGKEFSVDSAGTSNWHVGKSPDKRSVAIAKKYGIDISHQKARQFQSKDFADFDVIFVMDQSNYADVLALAKNEAERKKVRLILDENQEVPDPYYGGEDGFEMVYQMLDQATNQFLESIQYEK